MFSWCLSILVSWLEEWILVLTWLGSGQVHLLPDLISGSGKRVSRRANVYISAGKEIRCGFLLAQE